MSIMNIMKIINNMIVAVFLLFFALANEGCSHLVSSTSSMTPTSASLTAPSSDTNRPSDPVLNNLNNLNNNQSHHRSMLHEVEVELEDVLRRTISFDWPVDEARLSRGFSLKSQGPGKRKKRPHLGLDLAAPKGTRVYAAHDGKVIFSGNARGYGRMIIIETKDFWASVYAHLSKSVAKEGDLVKKGDLIGSIGRTGRATGNHLHFEIRHENVPMDPLYYLPSSGLSSSN